MITTRMIITILIYKEIKVIYRVVQGLLMEIQHAHGASCALDSDNHN